jgi:hypothetical protein
MLIIRSVVNIYFKHCVRKINDLFLLNLFVREDDHRIKWKCIKNRIYDCRSFSIFRLNKKNVFSKDKNDNLQYLFDDFCQIFFFIHIEDSFFAYFILLCWKIDRWSDAMIKVEMIKWNNHHVIKLISLFEKE